MNHLSVKDSCVDGKMSVADMAILNIYVMFTDGKMELEAVFKNNAPTAAKIVAKLMTNEKVAKMTKEAQAVPYLPF